MNKIQNIEKYKEQLEKYKHYLTILEKCSAFQPEVRLSLGIAIDMMKDRIRKVE